MWPAMYRGVGSMWYHVQVFAFTTCVPVTEFLLVQAMLVVCPYQTLKCLISCAYALFMSVD